MTLRERKLLKQVSIMHDSRCINVQWANQILRGDDVVSEQYHRKAYSREQAAEFAAEVENAAAYMQALGWTLDG